MGMRNEIFPFLTIPDELIECSPWRVSLSSGGEEREGPAFLENWDNSTDLMVSRSVSLKRDRVMDALGISDEYGHIDLVVFAGAGSGSLPVKKWLVHREGILPGSGSTDIDFVVNGTELADALHLETVLVLAQCPAGKVSPLSPSHKGDILWRDRTRIRLEGDISRFPVSETDLSAVLGHPWRDARWYLQVDWEDPQADFDTAVRLYVNSRCREFVRRFQEADAETLQLVMADVMVQIVREYLGREELRAYYESEGMHFSLVGVASHWMEQAFGSEAEARNMLEADPGRFHACLNALASVPEDKT